MEVMGDDSGSSLWDGGWWMVDGGSVITIISPCWAEEAWISDEEMKKKKNLKTYYRPKDMSEHIVWAMEVVSDESGLLLQGGG